MNGNPMIAQKQVEVNHNHGTDNERNKQSIYQASVLLVLGIYPMMSEEEGYFEQNLNTSKYKSVHRKQ